MPNKKRRKRSRYKTGIYVSTKTGQEIKYRSGWEKSYSEHLDNDPSVETYVYEGVIITYVSNKKTQRVRKYFPDFHVVLRDGRRLLVEIKPRRFIGKLQNSKKWNAAREWCVTNNSEFVVLTEVELKQLGVL